MNASSDSGQTDQVPARQRIAHATLELIAERGLSDVTMSAVATKAGVARQTLYNHYPDVDTIIGTVVEEHQNDSLQALNAVLATMVSPLSQLEHLVRHMAAIAQHGHPMIKQGLGISAQRVLDHYDREMRTIISDILVRGVEQREFRHGVQPGYDTTVIQRMVEATGELVNKTPPATAAIVAAVIATVRSAVGATEHSTAASDG